MAITLSSLMDRSRRRADMENSEFIDDSELIEYISASYLELYDLLVSKFEDYYVSTSTFSIASGQTYSLPADFYKLLGVDRAEGGDYYNLRPFNFNERNQNYSQFPFRFRNPDLRYRILGNTLYIEPEDQAVGDYKLWYVPRGTVLTTTSQEIDGVNGWEEYIVVDAAIKMLQKEESDVSTLYAQKQDLIKRINEQAQNRDVGESQRITDVNFNGSRFSSFDWI